MVLHKPRLVIAALRGGSGKTVVSLGLAAAWRKYHGLRIIPFKKGPDYIDAGWLSTAAQHPCYNLDPFLMQSDDMLRSFVYRSNRGDGSLIEGNRGLYDGVDIQGSFSTAELSKFLRAPVILVLDATKVTRTAAALVLGCQHLDPEVQIAGVVLNQVAGKRHEQVLRGAIESTCRIPVLGVIPREKKNFFPERHLGLVPPQESENTLHAVESAANRMRDCLDLEAIWSVAQQAPPLGCPVPLRQRTDDECTRPVTIGVMRDSAFQFYYPENLEALEEKGAKLIEISSFEHRPLPDIDALYIGGGFPETHLDILASNTEFMTSLRKEIESGLPVYAECGGLMFLCRQIVQAQRHFPMIGVFPFDVVLEEKPQGHGYTVLECVEENPFYAKGTAFSGHEFHYSRLMGIEEGFPFVFRLKKGHGIVAGWDGMCYKNVLASYSHIHAAGNELWASSVLRAARGHQQAKSGEPLALEADQERSKSGTYEHLTAI